MTNFGVEPEDEFRTNTVSTESDGCMERLERLFEQRAEKIRVLQEFIVLFGKRGEVNKQLKQLKQGNYENVQLAQQVRAAIARQKQVKIPLAKQLIRKSDALQQTMLNMIEELMNRDELNAKENIDNQASNSLQTPLVEKNDQKSKSPRLLLSDYTTSPYVRRLKPKELRFIDFERVITTAEFRNIPQYMKGRETQDELQLFLEDVIIRCFTRKYALIHKHRDVLRNQQDLALWRLYNQQAEYFPNEMFITEGDIATSTGRMVDKKTANRIVILRHIRVLQEKRHQKTTCYLWVRSAE